MMPKGSRRTTRCTADNGAIVDAELAKGKFFFIYQGSKQVEVKVNHCIPLFESRTTGESAIRSLQSSFDVNEDGIIGYGYGGGVKVVVKIPEHELQVVNRYLLERGQSKRDASDKTFGQGIQWYEIVDGIHIHRSLSDLERSRPDSFHEFRWTVTVIKWQTIMVLKAYSRARNVLQTANGVKMTIYNTISGLYEIALQKANLAREELTSFVFRGIITAIADEYCSRTRYSRQTTRTLTGAALRIKKGASEVLGKIMTEENDELARRVLEKTSSGNVSAEGIFDARAYKDTISTNTLRGATAFLNADGSDQSHARLRLKFSFEENGFKTFQAARLNKEIERFRRARRQGYIMKNVMSRNQWPLELIDISKKLYQTSVFDSELDKCEESTNLVIESRINEYGERIPLEAHLRLELYLRYLATMSETPAGESNPELPSDTGANGDSENMPMPIESDKNVDICDDIDKNGF